MIDADASTPAVTCLVMSSNPVARHVAKDYSGSIVSTSAQRRFTPQRLLSELWTRPKGQDGTCSYYIILPRPIGGL
jgi:hypothetical protein